MREYGYREFVNDTKELSDKLSDFGADGILFVARGGATLAHFLAMNMGVRNMFALNTCSYEGQKKVCKPTIDKLPNLDSSRKIIVVDEIVDTGETLKVALERLKGAYPNVEFKSAALFQRQDAAIQADYYLHLTDEWVEFFWERDGGESAVD